MKFSFSTFIVCTLASIMSTGFTIYMMERSPEMKALRAQVAACTGSNP